VTSEQVILTPLVAVGAIVSSFEKIGFISSAYQQLIMLIKNITSIALIITAMLLMLSFLYSPKRVVIQFNFFYETKYQE
jgi:hypothetical protein